MNEWDNMSDGIQTLIAYPKLSIYLHQTKFTKYNFVIKVKLKFKKTIKQLSFSIMTPISLTPLMML